MTRIIAKSFFVTFVSIVVSIGAMAGFGIEISGMTLWMPIACSLLCAFPGSFWNFYQQERLHDLNRQLEAAHSSLTQAHAALAQKASCDAMTGFLNRDAFLAAMETAKRDGHSGTLLMVDADNFKRINDQYGHLTGDSALILIASAIRDSVAETGVVGRIGGEEFCIFLKDIGLYHASEIADRLRKTVEQLVFKPADDKAHPLTVSVGGEMCRPGMDVFAILGEADRRLYAAKRGGRNRIVMPDPTAQAA